MKEASKQHQKNYKMKMNKYKIKCLQTVNILINSGIGSYHGTVNGKYRCISMFDTTVEGSPDP